MKTFYYGEPDRRFVHWAFRAKCRWPKSRFALLVPVAVILAFCLPIAWLCVKLGGFGHWLAYAVGLNSHDTWE